MLLITCHVLLTFRVINHSLSLFTELAPLLFVPQLLFAGFFIRTSLIPIFLRWAQYLCALKYALNLVLLTEFSPSLPSCSGGAALNCAFVITNNEVTTEMTFAYILILFALFIGFRLLGAVILVRKARRFY